MSILISRGFSSVRKPQEADCSVLEVLAHPHPHLTKHARGRFQSAVYREPETLDSFPLMPASYYCYYY